jgi:hypothetical protein
MPVHKGDNAARGAKPTISLRICSSTTSVTSFLRTIVSSQAARAATRPRTARA